MGSGFLSYAILIETILILLVWVAFIHWRLAKKKKELKVTEEVELPVPFEIYMQFINRELSETISQLDKLSEETADTETLSMYQYRLKHLDAEQKAMAEAKGDTVKFWQLYRSNIDFVHEAEEAEKTDDVSEVAEVTSVDTDPVADIESNIDTQSLEEKLEDFNKVSETVIEQSNDVIDLIETLAKKNESAELQHILGLLSGERDELVSQFESMRNEYNSMIRKIKLESLNESSSAVSHLPRADEDKPNMSGILSKQNSRISELNDVVGNLSLELEEKKALVKETQWVTRQLKETEHVVIILEDENNFLRDQIKQLLDVREKAE